MVTPITAISDCVSWINLSIGCWWLFVRINIYLDLWTQVPLQYLASRSVVKLLLLIGVALICSLFAQRRLVVSQYTTCLAGE